MSGICGLFNLDGAPTVEGKLRAMTAMMERRGPARTGLWHETCVGLGHTLLATTPELKFEQQPFVHADSGCTITADVRLDNREELLSALGFRPSSESTGDAELILRAYLKWGEQCPDYLLGDFAFGIQDTRRKMLFCARDHFGLRSLYYHHAPGQRFAFASDSRAILVLPEVPYAINEGRLADFLVPQLEWIDYTSTFFDDVYRLPPGHKVIVTRDKLRVAEYWRPEPGPDPGPISDDDYREGLLQVITKAVESRLRAPTGAVASMLSGGLDSGSIVAVAKGVLEAQGKPPLPTFSAARRDDGACAESRAIRAAVKMPSIAPTLVYLEDLQQHFEQLTTGYDEPFDGEFTILKAIYQAASAQGRCVLLDGAGGDVVLSEGSYIVRLLRHGRIGQAIAEIRAENRFWGGGIFVSSLIANLQTAFVPETIKARLRGVRHFRRVERYLKDSLISPEFATRVAIRDRFERMRQAFAGGWRDDYAIERCNAIRPSVTAGRERYARLASSFAMEPRDPFLDKRVVDFCTRLPGHLRLRDGWPKIVLRELMGGRLPDEVCWLRGKPHLGRFFNAAVTREAVYRGMLDIRSLNEALRGFVEPAALLRAWDAFRQDADEGRIHSAFVLSMWLRENANRPVVRKQRFG